MIKRIVAVGMAVAAVLVGATGAMAAGSATVAVSAEVVGTCKWVNTAGTMSFVLDPSVGGPVAGTVVQPTFWCTKGASYAITDDVGANESGTAFRMKHATIAEYIPYTFTYTAAGTGSGPGTTLNPGVGGLVAAVDYINATSGSYADTVTLSINP